MTRNTIVPVLALAVFALALFAAPALRADVPVPDSSGFFAYDNGKLIPMTKAYTQKKKLQVKGEEETFYGFPPDENKYFQVSADAVFVSNDPRMKPDKVKFRPLKYEGEMGNLKSENYQLRMWVGGGKKNPSIAVSGHPKNANVWIYTANPKLSPGKWMVMFETSLKDARDADYPAVFTFEIPE